MTWLSPKLWLSVALMAAAFMGGWASNGVIKDETIAQRDRVIAVRERELLQQIIDAQEVAAQQREQDAKIRALRDQKIAADAAVEAAQARANQVGKMLSTKARVDYVTLDNNANDCGFSDRGVRAWNSAASCSGLPETQAAGTGVDDGTIAARNAEIAEAAEMSFSAHCDAILQIKRLQNYIENECMVPEG